MFYYILDRLKSLTGRNDLITGGVNLILLGDFSQFPPVMDNVLFF